MRAVIFGLAALIIGLPPVASAATHPYFTNTVLIDQNGAPHRFYDDLLRGKTVVITSFFSSCAGTCPIMNATFGKIQASLGSRLGKDVYLLSITVDPENDTPARLKEYARRVGARPGWFFLTGSKKDVDEVLAKLGYSVSAREQHKNIFLLGNESTGVWKKLFGLAGADEIIPIVNGVIRDP